MYPARSIARDQRADGRRHPRRRGDACVRARLRARGGNRRVPPGRTRPASPCCALATSSTHSSPQNLDPARCSLPTACSAATASTAARWRDGEQPARQLHPPTGSHTGGNDWLRCLSPSPCRRVRDEAARGRSTTPAPERTWSHHRRAPGASATARRGRLPKATRAPPERLVGGFARALAEREGLG